MRYPVESIIFHMRYPVESVIFHIRYPVESVIFHMRYPHPVESVIFHMRYPVECWKRMPGMKRLKTIFLKLARKSYTVENDNMS